MATLINGNGNEAVYAQQDADWYAGVEGDATKILNVGSKLAATIEDANTIALADGAIITKEGRRIQVDVGNIDEFTIPTGQAGTTRYYIIGYHLYTDGSANQKCETFVQLMSDGTETITENTFRAGSNEVYISVYRVKQEGLTLNDPEALLTVASSMTDIEGDIAQLNSDLTALEGTVPDITVDATNKTYATALGEIFASIDFSKVTYHCHIIVSGVYARLSKCSPNAYIEFDSGFWGNTSALSTEFFTLTSGGGSMRASLTCSASGNVLTNYSNTVVGTSIYFYY